MLTALLLPILLDGPEPLVVRGKLLFAGKREVRLQGLNVPSLEWSNEGENVLRSAKVAIEDWNSNCLRVPLSQDRWFGKASGQTDGGNGYRKLVDDLVRFASERKVYVVLDLHWSNGGVWGKHLQQHAMPDDHSTTFWIDVAKKYQNHPAILFDLYNEPRDVSWEVWRNGGMVTNRVDGGGEVTYHSPGMQGLLDAIRKAGARNPVVVGGLDWGYDLSGVLEGFALRDAKGRGIVYSAHIYPWKSDWDGKVGRISVKHPVLIGEVGCEPDPKQEDPATWGPRMLDWIDAKRLNWTGWCFHPSASPRMLLNWNYEPTPYWGELVKKRLTKR